MSKPGRIPGTRARRTLLLIPSIPDALDEATKNGLAIRNAASTTGTCPDCGAEANLHHDPEHDGVYHLVFQHEHHCRALTDGAAA